MRKSIVLFLLAVAALQAFGLDGPAQTKSSASLSSSALWTTQDARKDQIVKNNQAVFDELNALMAKGIKLTYVPGNHDMTLEGDILDRALPGINQARDVNGLGKCVTGIRDEIVIEHGHRYDVFSAPDSVSNKEITGDAPSILPPGYFYARIAASEEASRC